jgi:hypothetical protein
VLALAANLSNNYCACAIPQSGNPNAGQVAWTPPSLFSKVRVCPKGFTKMPDPLSSGATCRVVSGGQVGAPSFPSSCLNLQLSLPTYGWLCERLLSQASQGRLVCLQTYVGQSFYDLREGRRREICQYFAPASGVQPKVTIATKFSLMCIRPGPCRVCTLGDTVWCRNCP